MKLNASFIMLIAAVAYARPLADGQDSRDISVGSNVRRTSEFDAIYERDLALDERDFQDSIRNGWDHIKAWGKTFPEIVKSVWSSAKHGDMTTAAPDPSGASVQRRTAYPAQITAQTVPPLDGRDLPSPISGNDIPRATPISTSTSLGYRITAGPTPPLGDASPTAPPEPTVPAAPAPTHLKQRRGLGDLQAMRAKAQGKLRHGTNRRDSLHQRGETMDQFLNGLSQTGHAAVHGAQQAGHTVGTVAAGAFNGAKNAAQDPPARRDLVDAAKWTQDKGNEAKQRLDNTRTWVSQSVNETIESNKPLSDVANGAQSIGNGLHEAKNSIGESVSTAASDTMNTASDAKNKVKDTVSGAADATANAASKAKDKVEDTANGVGNGLKGAATGAAHGFEEGQTST
ncbi:hypothetical protein D9757_003650 [Collybiopsis confluens]|uniref:Uncharacterized protein n=1 Tax=Collybiopsis confluens TaxID=2823264 RepID=A0A8H5HUW9_9AGAR|nr:hypothetical protein D9757_003650 [Collybiopsis confluens]